MIKKYKDDSIEVEERKVKAFLNNEVKSYAKYVIETRAMPNIMDGLRVGARKIIWAAMTGDVSKKNKVKMPSLIGDAMKMHYNHGDASLMNTIIQLCSTHVYKFAPLEAIGQIGTLRVPKCDTAPRYLHVKKTPYLEVFRTDIELLERLMDDGEEVEPKFFLPIIPVTLLWRTNSPGYGFSYRSFSYDIDSIIDNCIKAIHFGSCNSDIDEIPLVPYVDGIDPENMIYNSNKNTWYSVGKYDRDFDKDILIIKDLPYSINFEKFEEHLQDLIDRNYIVSYNDLSLDGNIKYIIQFAKGRLKLLSNDKWKFFQQMKLFVKVKKDTLNVIDEDGKTMLFFDTPYEFIDEFVKRRLRYYDKRKTKTISVLNEKINVLSDKIKFINLVINDELVINKRKSADIKLDLDGHNIDHKVLKMNIDKLTEEEINKMLDEKQDLMDSLSYIENSTIREMYIRDLIKFKKDFCNVKSIETV